jgi:hypothetical protein
MFFRKGKILFLLFLCFSFCAKKAPPPGKPDIDPPDVEIVSPENGAFVSGTTLVKVNAKDRSKVIYVEAFADKNSLGQDSSEPYIFKFLPFDSIHFLSAVAIDEWDNRGKSGRIKVINKDFKRDTTNKE